MIDRFTIQMLQETGTEQLRDDLAMHEAGYARGSRDGSAVTQAAGDHRESAMLIRTILGRRRDR